MPARKTDIAVLEQHFGENQWRVLGYIGPDRPGLIVTQHTLHPGMSIRVRYFDHDESTIAVPLDEPVAS